MCDPGGSAPVGGSAPGGRSRPGGRFAPGALVEREHELTALQHRLAEARAGHGSVSYVEAGAGGGKSALLAQVTGMAQGAGMSVVAARGHELEREFPFGVCVALFEQCWLTSDAAELDRLRTGPAGRAIDVLGGEPGDRYIAPRHDSPPDALRGSIADRQTPPSDRWFTVIHGLYWLARNLAESGARPGGVGHALAVVVDDLHWADWPSLRYLAYLAARIEHLPIALVVAGADGAPSTDRRAHNAVRDAAGDAVLALRALSRAGVAAIVRSRLPTASTAVCEACSRLSAGNPMLLVALLDELRRVETRPDQMTAAELGRLSPRPVQRMVRAQLAALPEAAGSIADAVALLGPGTPLPTAARVAGVDLDTAARCADALVAIHLFTAGTALSFTSPLVAGMVGAALPERDRERMRGRAAALVSDEAAPRAAPVAPDPVAIPADEPSGAPRAQRSDQDLGASALAARATAEIAATRVGAPRAAPTGLQALTPSERRVAELAAGGLTTREMAARLFVTPKTVEFHLRNVYRKLEVPSSRTELTRVLAPEPEDLVTE